MAAHHFRERLSCLADEYESIEADRKRLQEEATALKEILASNGWAVQDAASAASKSEVAPQLLMLQAPQKPVEIDSYAAIPSSPSAASLEPTNTNLMPRSFSHCSLSSESRQIDSTRTHTSKQSAVIGEHEAFSPSDWVFAEATATAETPQMTHVDTCNFLEEPFREFSHRAGWSEVHSTSVNLDTFLGNGQVTRHTHRICLLHPLGKRRLSWDLLVFMMLFYEAWSLSFVYVYLQEVSVPKFLEISGRILTIFWFLDILLNFTTGYIDGDTVNLSRRDVARRYLKGWFAVDFIASVPWDVLFSSGGFSRLFRFGKATKMMKVLRYLRTIRAIRFLKSLAKSAQVEHYSEAALHWTLSYKALQIMAALVVLSHFHGLVYALIDNDLTTAQNVHDALSFYCQSFWWAYGTFVVGSINHGNDALFGLWTLQVIMLSERLALMAVGVACVFPKVFARKVRQAERDLMKDDTLCYLKTRKVSFSTCVRVLFHLEQTSEALVLQENFNALMDKDIPLELRRTVCEELWSSSLLSLGLILHISHWHTDFLTELCKCVFQETHPEKTVLCKGGDTAISTYFVLKGCLAMFGDHESFPDISEGMWLGENALVNPSLRRRGTAVTSKMAQLMVLPSFKFHETLAALGLVEKFESLCAEHIWKGLCGRCGSLGDHFPDDCPMTLPNKFSSEETPRCGHSRSAKSFITGMVTRVSSYKSTMIGSVKDDTVPKYHTESPLLKHFLHHHSLQHLEGHLGDLGIVDLDGLHKYSSEHAIHEALPNHVIASLPQHALQALSFSAIKQFCENSHEMIKTRLFITQGMKHFVFVSHYKMNAGTEAALIRQELELRFRQDSGSPANMYECPIFLDSEDLEDLDDLQDHVTKSHNIVLLLTEGVLTRPWILVELVTAVQADIRIVLVQIFKPGVKFDFPDARFIKDLTEGRILDEAGHDILRNCNIELSMLGPVIHQIFHKIAVPYSPHASSIVRQAQLTSLQKLLHLKDRTPRPLSAQMQARSRAASARESRRQRSCLRVMNEIHDEQEAVSNVSVRVSM